MGREWKRTPSQEVYLNDQVPELLKARKDKDVKGFVSRAHDQWERRWPERKAVFPEQNEGPQVLTTDQMDTLGKAITQRKARIYARVRWITGTKPIRTQNPQNLLARYLRTVKKAKSKGKKKGPRKRSLLEVYHDLYYEVKLRGLIQEALKKEPDVESLSSQQRSSRYLTLYQRIRSESWAAESEAIKTEVTQIYNEEHQSPVAKKDANEEKNANENTGDNGADTGSEERDVVLRQQECIDLIGPIITSFLKDASEATGWAFVVLGGGMDKSGEIKIASTSVGKTVDGVTFTNAHKHWQEGVLKPWMDFLHMRNPIEEHHARAAMWAPDSLDASAPLELVRDAVSLQHEATVPQDETPGMAAHGATLLQHQPPLCTAAPVLSPTPQVPTLQPHPSPAASLSSSATPATPLQHQSATQPVQPRPQPRPVMQAMANVGNTATLLPDPNSVVTGFAAPFSSSSAQVATLLQHQSAAAATQAQATTSFGNTLTPAPGVFSGNPPAAFNYPPGYDAYNYPLAWQDNTIVPIMPRLSYSLLDELYDFSGIDTTYGPPPFDSTGSQNSPMCPNPNGGGSPATGGIATTYQNPVVMGDQAHATALYPSQPAPAVNTVPSSNSGAVLTSVSMGASDATPPMLPTLNDATNQITTPAPQVPKEHSSKKKRTTYEEKNAHCILPEGSRRASKRRCPDDENTAPAQKPKGGVRKKGRKT